MRLDLVELAEGPINVQREQRVAAHPICLQRRDQGPPWVADVRQRPGPRKSLHIPEVCPACRLCLAVGKIAFVEGKDATPDIKQDALAQT